MAIVFDENLKVITVESPAVTLTIQTLYDEIRLFEEKMPFLFVAQIAKGSGKQDIGGGAKVGITLELIDDWRLSFEARAGPDTILCTVSGGNLVATNQYSNNPIKPTAFTQVTIAQSSSPTIIQAASDTNLLYLVESLRGTHASIGNVWYWDPTGGSNSNDGTSPAKAVATFAQAQTLAADGNNDIIFALSNDASGITTVDEIITITKDALKLRGPGFPFQIKPTSTAADTITINAGSCEISGIYLETAATGTRDGIVVAGNNNLIKDCWIANVRGNGIKISASARTKIQTCAIENCGLSGTGDGIKMGNTVTQSLVSKSVLFNCVNGASLAGTGLTDNIFENNLVYKNSAYGITIGSGVVRTVVRSGHTFASNTSGDTQDSGSSTFIETLAGGASAGAVADAVWDELVTDHLAANSTGKTLRDAKTRATLASLK